MSLRETYLDLVREGRCLLAELGLSHSEFVALESCVHGPARASTIAEAIGISSAGATDLIDRLERRHLVRRRTDSRDRRVVLVKLTPPGERLFRKAQSAYRTMLHRVGLSITDQERGALVEGLSALARAVNGADG